MRALRLAAALLSLGTAPALADANTLLPAILEGQAVLPANTLVPPPPDAPPALALSGKFTGPGGRRVDEAGTIPGRTNPGPSGRPTGIGLPVKGQPVQGLSSLRAAGDGTVWGLADNGYGAKGNSADAALALHRFKLDFGGGAAERVETLWLSDPDRRFPWPITLEGTDRRYLTGADIDPESLVVVPDGFWVSDEFGPFLLRFDRQGRLRELVEAEVDGKPARSPDHPALRLPGTPDQPLAFEVGRSRGFESLMASPDGRKLYALMEGPVWKEGAAERWADGKPRLRWLVYDTVDRRWTGEGWTYPLEAEGNVVAEATWLDERRALVLERDGGEGDASLACPAGQPAPTCFERPARFKRLYLVTRPPEGAAGAAVAKEGYVDLLAIADPKGLAKQGGAEGRYAMPFVTIESAALLPDGRILVANDNNFPFSAGRFLDRADDTEFVVLRVEGLAK